MSTTTRHRQSASRGCASMSRRIDRIASDVDEWPELTPAQRAVIAAAFRTRRVTA